MGQVLNLQQMLGTGSGFASGSLGTAGLGSAAGLAGSIQEARQPRPCRQMSGSRTALPGCGGPSIRHAALSAGSLLSPRQ